MARRGKSLFKPKGPRGPGRFRERELARAVRAAKAAGGERVEVDPVTGKITVIVRGAGDVADKTNSWDEILPDARRQPA